MLQKNEISKEVQFWTIAINSLAYFMLAFFTVIILTNSFSILLANLEGVEGVLYYYGFNILTFDRSWSKELTFLVFFFGISFSLVLGIIFERAYKKARKHSKHYKMYFLWGYFLSFSYFFGNVLVGSFFYFGMGVIFDIFSIPWVFRIVTGITALAALAFLGIYATRGFIISLNSYQTFVERPEFRWFIKAQLIYPAIIGIVITVFLKVPHHNDFFMLDNLVWFSLVVPILSLYLNLSSQPSIRFTRKLPPIHIFKIPILIFVTVMLIYRIGLIGGLKF